MGEFNYFSIPNRMGNKASKYSMLNIQTGNDVEESSFVHFQDPEEGGEDEGSEIEIKRVTDWENNSSKKNEEKRREEEQKREIEEEIKRLNVSLLQMQQNLSNLSSNLSSLSSKLKNNEKRGKKGKEGEAKEGTKKNRFLKPWLTNNMLLITLAWQVLNVLLYRLGFDKNYQNKNSVEFDVGVAIMLYSLSFLLLIFLLTLSSFQSSLNPFPKKVSFSFSN